MIVSTSCTQSGPPTVGDIYEVCIETEKGTTEKLQIYDSSGSVSDANVIIFMPMGYLLLLLYSCSRHQETTMNKITSSALHM